MSTPQKASRAKGSVERSPPKEVLYTKITEAVPITTVLPERSKKKKRKSSKKEKLTQ
ncbi:hypothetical protein A2U01_0101045, partial [Trifolium medium]|nr:hypothetical protein [Trifolium medium]